MEHNQIYLIKRNQEQQNIIGYMVDCFNLEHMGSESILTKVYVGSHNKQSDVNMLKAQKNAILKSVLGNKALLAKTEDTVKITFSSNDIKSIYKTLVLIEYLKGTLSFPDDQITTHFEDILVKLRRLDFFKVNIRSLTNIVINFDYNKNLNRDVIEWYTDEICF